MSRSVRVAQVCPEGLAFGLSQRRQVEYLQSLGYEVHAVTNSGAHEATLRSMAVPCHLVGFTRAITPFRDLMCLVTMTEIFRREGFDLVHTHAPKGGVLGVWAAALAGVPVVVHTVHGFFFGREMSGAARAALIMLDRVAALGIHCMLSQADEDRVFALRHHIARRRQIAFLGNGIDLKRFDPSVVRPTREDMRAALGLPKDAWVMGMVGRFDWSKGFREFFEAAAWLCQRTAKAHFLVVGMRLSNERDPVPDDHPMYTRLDRRLLRLENRDDMPALYQAMDVLMHPSHHEGFPRVVMEAAAMGIPAVGFDISGNRAAVRRGETGCLVPKYDARALAQTVLDLLEQPERRRAMGAAARALALRAFDEEIVCARIAATYAELLRRRGRSSCTGAGTRPSPGPVTFVHRMGEAY